MSDKNTSNEKFESLLKQIEEMTVLELSKFVKLLEEKFGVSAAMPMMAVPAGGAPQSGPEEPKEEKTTFDVELTNAGANKIAVIKALRTVTTLGLKDAKDLVEAAPKMVQPGAPKEDAEKIKKVLEEAGAQVSLK